MYLLIINIVSSEKIKKIPARWKTLTLAQNPVNSRKNTSSKAGNAISKAMSAEVVVVPFQNNAKRNSAIKGDIIMVQVSWT